VLKNKFTLEIAGESYEVVPDFETIDVFESMAGVSVSGVAFLINASKTGEDESDEAHLARLMGLVKTRYIVAAVYASLGPRVESMAEAGALVQKHGLSRSVEFLTAFVTNALKGDEASEQPGEPGGVSEKNQ